MKLLPTPNIVWVGLAPVTLNCRLNQIQGRAAMDVFVQTVSSKVYHAKAVSRVVDMVDPGGRVAIDEANC